MIAIDTKTTAPAYRDAMALLASAVHLVTTDGLGGRAGFTASAVCSVSDMPPTLLVCLNRSSSAFAAFSGNTSLCVNTLAAEQRTVADAFGGRTPMAERFAAARWTDGATGAPVLAGALVSFDCRIVSRTSVATHDVLFCEVIALVDSAPNDALVYANRRYHTVPNERTDLRTLRAAERVEGLGNGWAAEARRAALRLA